MNAVGRDVTDGRHRRGLATREKILAAARDAFLESGFTGTTIAAIARRAGVSEPTVYYSYKTKEDILAAALEREIAGEGTPTPLAQQEWIADLLAESDPVKQLERLVDGAGKILQRAGGLIITARAAATAGNESLAALGTTRLQQRLQFQRTCIDALTSKTPLRPGLTQSRAVDVATLLLGPESYLFLTGDLGWTHDEWHDWVGGCLTRELLPPRNAMNLSEYPVSRSGATEGVSPPRPGAGQQRWEGDTDRIAER